jgi:hypothetical protein
LSRITSRKASLKSTSEAIKLITSRNGFSVQRSLSILSRNKSDDGASSSSNAFGPYGLTLLHAPSEPLVDLIFVHGLRGGSVKTWSKHEDIQYFWPQAWLPQEPDLQHARIHTFGYNSDWGERRESILNVHDFGKDLLGEMSTNPYLRAQAESPIILIGHSMGGLGMHGNPPIHPHQPSSECFSKLTSLLQSSRKRTSWPGETMQLEIVLRAYNASCFLRHHTEAPA